MSLKVFGIMAPVVLGGIWFTGVVGGGYSRDVDRPPTQVMRALADLDITDQPGRPGTDPSQSGGVRPLFRTERGDNEISFLVMSGDKVATRMTAHLEPLDGGRRTRVTASVERGDAPDDFVSPAFRSRGVTLGLFAIVLEHELDELTAPPRKSRAECQELAQQLLLANAPGGERSMAQGARSIMAVQAVAAELRRQGCPLGSGGGDFEPVSSVMDGGGAANGGRRGEVNFEAGRPMVDVSRSGR